jgi:hypothetical protein
LPRARSSAARRSQLAQADVIKQRQENRKETAATDAQHQGRASTPRAT